MTTSSSRRRVRLSSLGSAAEGNPLIDAHVGGEIRERYRERIRTFDSEGNLAHQEEVEGPVDTGPVKNRPPTEIVWDGEGHRVEETVVSEIGPVVREGELVKARWIAVDASSHDIYVSTGVESGAEGPLAEPAVVRVFDGEDPGHPLIRTIDGSCLPEGHFGANGASSVSVALDESNGHVFVDDRASSNFSARNVYEFTETGECVSTIEHSFEYAFVSEIAIDNGAHSPNGALNPDGRYLFVPSGEVGTKSHLYAFGPVPKVHEAPAVESTSFGDVAETEAELRATVNPKSTATHYAFQYTTQASYKDEGFGSSITAGEGDLPVGNLGVQVAVAVTGLTPGTTYRFRVVAESLCVPEGCSSEGEASFATFASVVQSGSCANAALRSGPSIALPDCRAYELVTPANTNGKAPRAPNTNSAGPQFGTPPASPEGGSIAFLTTGGAIPGYPGAGAFNGDLYVADRTAAGWQTESAGPSGTLSTNPVPGGLSPDHAYATGYTGPEDAGSMVVGEFTNYVHRPDGSFKPLGEGSLGIDPGATPRMISAGGAHIVFETRTVGAALPLQLEPDAPPTGTGAIYDRTPDDTVHVVSLLPGDLTPAGGEESAYRGASADGSVVAFEVGTSSPLYLRVKDAETLEAGPAGSTFAGLSAAGRYAFYLNAGDLYRFDTQTKASLRVTESGDVTVVNVPSNGTSAYFGSPSALSSEPNPQGDEAQGGAPNLYRWSGGTTSFIATVSEADMDGEFTGQYTRYGLGQWVEGLAYGTTASSPARTTPDGTTIVFQSEANLTGYESGGASEVYRYSAAEGGLECLSCDPTQAPPSGDARLQTIAVTGDPGPDNAYAQVPNLAPDGGRVFFESRDALVPADTDGHRDVYEWEADGVGSCATPGGCLFLISSGKSARDDYLFGVSQSGDDVFIYTSDLLSEEDGDETPSVYDARAGGGFAASSSSSAECLGEACQPAASAPEESTPASATFQGAGNVVEAPVAKKRGCPKGKRKVRKAGKSHCVAKHTKSKKMHHKKRARKRAHDKRRAAR